VPYFFGPPRTRAARRLNQQVDLCLCKPPIGNRAILRTAGGRRLARIRK